MTDETCEDGDAIYHGCSMVVPCDGDSGGAPEMSWCLIDPDADPDCAPHGINWDYCKPNRRSRVIAVGQPYRSCQDVHTWRWLLANPGQSCLDAGCVWNVVTYTCSDDGNCVEAAGGLTEWGLETWQHDWRTDSSAAGCTQLSLVMVAASLLLRVGP